MSQENVEIVLEANEAWRRGDLDAVLRALDPGIEWHTAADEPDAGTHRGVEAVISLIADWARSFEDFSVEPLEFIDAGDRVVMPITARGRPHGSAQTVEVPETQGYTVRNGTIVEVREYPTKAEALKILGLSQWAISQANVEIIRRATDAAGAAHAPDHPDSARTGTGIDGGYPR